MDSVMCVENQTGGSVATGQQEPQFRVEKILDIKRQLAEGRYEIEEKLDVVVDRLLEDLL
jgi:anti-sigma28 factor (negative regulator of flagellin synthesis)